MTTLLRMVAHLPPAFSRFVFGAPDQDYRGPLCFASFDLDSSYSRPFQRRRH